jgi:hypothetical protein
VVSHSGPMGLLGSLQFGVHPTEHHWRRGC